jgi:uncharacterized protein YkvS
MKKLEYIVDNLKHFSPHELYCLLIWIEREINAADKSQNLKDSFAVGDRLCWFDAKHNCYKYGVIISKKSNQVVLQSEDLVVHKIPYYALNLEKITSANANNIGNLTKKDFKVGDVVEFNHDGIPHNGSVVKLYYNAAIIDVVGYSGLRRVTYNCLTKSEQNNENLKLF